ncbi:sensor histidine kinase [Veronia pacifica]|uniref:Uncharacterized protein n=1 Tax=Veronia pacifica TaxID=1080227 RepID=A0A1C3ERL1_9GAMM|nr:histidine kinase [Veronia pacifica]ODA35889.1 hypothetical protein A8L45_02315 [Veronia pacifica]
MLNANAILSNRWSASVFITSGLCLVISIFTYSIWGTSYIGHLIVSFGYGYSNLGLSWLSYWLFPNWSETFRGFVVVPLALALGTLNCYVILIDKDPSLSALKPTFLLGLTFTLICIYYLHNREQKHQAKQALEEARRKQAEQEKLLVLSELQQLQSQIEPHFLFNTLANIDALIGMEPEKAQSMLRHLTILLRGSLEVTRERLVPLHRESDLISNYLTIQQIRLGGAMTFDIRVDPDIQGIHLPPFLIQPLVENAVVHGIEPHTERGHIEINFSQSEEEYTFSVSDNGIGLSGESSGKGNGIAIKNIRARIDKLFDGKASLRVSENTPQGVVSCLSVSKSALNSLIEEDNK